ncbi:MAG: Ppx/GppA phosphatase family protein, partial [Stellaceae bacterium]
MSNSAFHRIGPVEARCPDGGSPILHAEHAAGVGHAAAPPRTAANYAALDLGTNNCRLLIARPSGGGFRVVDAFSRIVRLGEGVAASGSLSEAAMTRTFDALKVCADKIAYRHSVAGRYVATEACRRAANCVEFIARVRRELGIEFEIISTAEEARLVVAGCAPLLNPRAPYALVFDIGGGSTEIVWLRQGGARRGGRRSAHGHPWAGPARPE